MRIAYLTNQYPAASHTFIRREILAVEARGVEVERVTIRRAESGLRDPADLEEQRRTECVLDAGALRLAATALSTFLGRPASFVRALALALRLARNSTSGRLLHLVYLVEACWLFRIARLRSIAHVHVHFGTNPAAVAMLCRRLGGPPYSVVIHGSLEFDRPLELSLREKISDAAFVVAISRFGKSQILRWCPPSEWEKVHIVHCGVDQGYVQEDPTPVPDARRLIWIGRMSEDKGLPVLLDASRLLAAEGESFELVLAGDGPLRRYLEEVVARHGLAACVKFAGWLADAQAREAIERSRAMVLPSFAEGLPLVLMEAMARGRPVIASRIAGIPELVRDGESGWLVTPASVSELSRAIRSALEASPEQLTRMGLEGRRRALARHDVRRSAEILERLMSQAIGTTVSN